MSLDRTVRKVVYKGDGTTASFPFAFKVFEPSDIAVEIGIPNETLESTVGNFSLRYSGLPLDSATKSPLLQIF